MSRKSKSKGLPLSGIEPILDLAMWSTPKAIGNHNCYAFSLLNFQNSHGPTPKQQPGARAGLNLNRSNLSTCEIAQRVLADNPGNIYREKAESPCRKGFHKIFLFNDPHPDTGDFHFYVQTKDLIYTRKSGEDIQAIASKFKIPTRNMYYLGRNRILLKNVNIFAHKLGHATGALVDDSCGRIIKDPRKACRSVGGRKYSLDCGSFCARTGRVKSK